MNLSNIKKRLSRSGTPFNRRGIIMLGGMFATLLAFIVIWHSQTTFRAMSECATCAPHDASATSPSRR